MAKKDHLFAVVDLETTGGLAKRDKIIEVGIVLTDGNKIIDQYSSLIDPERSIPPEITRITGINDEMVSGKPRFYEVAKDIVEWTDGAIFVAHNVRFDYGFLQRAFKDLGYTYSKKLLCTARLSRSLYPEHRSHSLGSLISRYNLEVNDRHRALDDALATAKLLMKWLSLEKGADTVKEFINLGVKESKLPPSLNLERLHGLPDQTGVYYFYDSTGELIYIGKAKDIRSRVMQHFAGQNRKSRDMQQYVHDIQYEITASEIAAWLKESAEIKKFKPRLNKAQRISYFPIAVVLTNGADGFSRLEIKPRSKLRPAREVVCSFFSTRGAANAVIRERIRAFALCPEINAGEDIGELCTAAQMKICTGACGALETPKQYNERVELAADTMTKLFDKDFLFGEEGRQRNEWYFVAVEGGTITKGGFLSDDFGTLDERTIIGELPDFPGTIEDNRILWNYLKKQKRPRIIYL